MTEEIPTGTNGIKSVKISRRAIWFLATFFILSFSCLCSSVFSISRMVTKMISGDGIENIDINIEMLLSITFEKDGPRIDKRIIGGGFNYRFQNSSNTIL